MASRFPIRGQMLVIVLLFTVFIVAVVLFSRTRPADRLYDPDSRAPGGLLLLRHWLQEMGYRVETTGSRAFTLSNRADLLFVYPGLELFDEAEAERLVAWVEAGGTLAIVGSHVILADFFDFEFVSPDFTAMAAPVRQAQPLLPQAPSELSGPGPGSLPAVDATGGAVPVLIAADGHPVVWVQPWGEGTLWLLPQRYAFTNADLMEKEQAHLLLALLRTVPTGGTVIFDTYHLFGPNPLADGRILSIQDWLYSTPLGWAMLFLLLLGGLYLLLGGRRLGPALVVVTQGRRREASEYVVAMAGLQRRARVRDSVARHHRQRLLLALGRPHRIQPDVSDEEFLQQVRAADPWLSGERAEQIARVLQGLGRLPDEEQLVALVAEVDAIIGRSAHLH